MSFCTNCGQEIKEGDQYCIGCGKKVNEPVFSQHPNNTVRKCPNCGEPLPAFAICCTSCGHEFRGIKTSSSEITTFIEKLNSMGEGKKGARRKAEYIRSYNVPNNRDAIFEFITYAAANIDTRLMEKATTQAGMKGSEYKAQIALTQAWLRKYEEVYKKAERKFGNDASFQQIRYLHDAKQSDLKAATRAYKWANSSLRSCLLMFVATALLLGTFIFVGIMLFKVLRK